MDTLYIVASQVYKYKQGSKLKIDLTSSTDENDASTTLYETAEELWKAKKYKDAVIIHQQNYMMYKHACSAYRCDVAYSEGYGV